MPRAVTSDEKRTPLWATLNASAAALRWLWLLREWISKQSNPGTSCWRPTRLNSAAMRPVARAVGRNTMALVLVFWRISSRRRASVCGKTSRSEGGRRENCGTAWCVFSSSGGMVDTNLCEGASAMAPSWCTWGGIVAENMSDWRGADWREGRCEMIRSQSWRNPCSRRRSASSKMRVRRPDSLGLRPPFWRWSRRRPGVAIRKSASEGRQRENLAEGHAKESDSPQRSVFKRLVSAFMLVPPTTCWTL